MTQRRPHVQFRVIMYENDYDWGVQRLEMVNILWLLMTNPNASIHNMHQHIHLVIGLHTNTDGHTPVDIKQKKKKGWGSENHQANLHAVTNPGRGHPYTCSLEFPSLRDLLRPFLSSCFTSLTDNIWHCV